MAERACEACRFWCTDGITGDGDVPANSGACRYDPPRLILATAPRTLRAWTSLPGGAIDEHEAGKEEARGVWPLTFAWAWCGKWEPRPE